MTYQLPTTEEKADYVLKQFDRIAGKYDLVNDLISFGMHRLWKQRAISELVSATGRRMASPLRLDAASADRNAEAPTNCHADIAHNGSIDGSTSCRGDAMRRPTADPDQFDSYLDVCCGTGDLALMIAQRPKNNAKVSGLDFSPEMLQVARQRAAKNSQNIEFKQGDAQDLPYPDNSFDGAIISFGLRNLTDLQKGLKEMSRVVKSGGRVINLDLGQPDMPVFTPFFVFFFDKIVPLIGELVQQDRQAYTYLPESRKNYPHPEKLSKMFEEAGLADVHWLKLACGSVALHVGTVK